MPGAAAGPSRKPGRFVCCLCVMYLPTLQARQLTLCPAGGALLRPLASCSRLGRWLLGIAAAPAQGCVARRPALWDEGPDHGPACSATPCSGVSRVSPGPPFSPFFPLRKRPCAPFLPPPTPSEVGLPRAAPRGVRGPRCGAAPRRGGGRVGWSRCGDGQGPAREFDR